MSHSEKELVRNFKTEVYLKKTNLELLGFENSSLFQYRDCISRVVLDRCADSTQAAVETLMGVRRREMTLTCRGFNRDICSGSQPMVLLNRALLFLAAMLTSFMTFKQRSSAHHF